MRAPRFGFLGLLILGPLACSQAGAEDQPLQAILGATTSTGPVLRVSLDATASLDAAFYQPAVDLLYGHAVAINTQLAASGWEFSTFTEDAFTARPYALVFYPTPPVSPECPAVRHSEAGRIFAETERAERDEAERACDRLTAAQHQEYQDSLDRAQRELREALTPPTLRVSVCTALWDLFYRISLSSGPATELVFTDGREACRSGDVPQIESPKDDVFVVVVLLPGARDEAQHAREYFQERRETLLRFLPWPRLVVIPWFALAPDVFVSDTSRRLVE